MADTVMNIENIPTSEIESMAKSNGLKAMFAELEKRAFEELLQLPMWASRKRQNALIQRIQVIRDVQSEIEVFKTIRRQADGQ